MTAGAAGVSFNQGRQPTSHPPGPGLPPMVLTVGPNAHLTSKLTVDVTVSVSCGPFVSEEYGNLQLQLSEAAGSTSPATRRTAGCGSRGT